MDTKLMEEIGLTKSEVSVYLALLVLGSSTTGPIIDKSGASSSKIYEILEKLMKKGLASYVIKGKVKYFEPSPPQRIMDYISEKESRLAMQKAALEKMMPELMLKRQMSKHMQDASIYKGMKGLYTAFYDALKTMKKGDAIDVIGVPSRSSKVNLFFVRFNKARAGQGVRMRVLFNENARGELQTMPKHNPLSELRYMPEGVLTPAAINIFDDRTIIFPSESGAEPLVIVINSREVADSFRAQFEILWNQQTRVYTGLDGPKLVLKDMMIKERRELLAIGLEHEKLPQHVPEELGLFVKEIEDKKIPERLLFRKGTKIEKNMLSKHSKVRFLPEQYISPLHMEIYGNKIAIIDWTKPITTIIIEKKAIADGYRKYFELLWRIAKA